MRWSPNAQLSKEKAALRTQHTATRHAGISTQMSSTEHFRSPEGELPCPRSFRRLCTHVDNEGKKHCRRKPATISPTGSIQPPPKRKCSETALVNQLVNQLAQRGQNLKYNMASKRTQQPLTQICRCARYFSETVRDVQRPFQRPL